MSFPISAFLASFEKEFGQLAHELPWAIPPKLPSIISTLLPFLGDEYVISDGVAIHKTATVEQGVVIKGPAIVGPDCFIGAHAYIRGGVYLGEKVSIGPGCEVKSTIVLAHSSLAHFNFVGDSLVGSHVNFEAGSVVANHYNERADKQISVLYNGKIIGTGATKFGAAVSDGCRIGANAVLSPGTLLLPNTVVKRLELVEQVISR